MATPLVAVAVSVPLSTPLAGSLDRPIVIGPLKDRLHVAVGIRDRDRQAEGITRRDGGRRLSRDHELRGGGGRSR